MTDLMTRPANGNGMVQVDEDGVLVEAISSSVLEAQTRGEIDIQIKTARAYPRSIRTFLNTALEMATLDVETAERCFYALPRGGKTIEGPSVRLAEIVASAWQHMRVETKIVANDGRFLTARGVAWDLQNNVAVATEVQRRITDRNGRTFNDDMVTVTANAACAIARRNAVFAVVPNSYTRQIYERCRLVAVGDASTLVNNRAKVLKGLMQMGATNDRVFAMLGIKGEEDITLEHLALLKGMGNAIRDGDTTVDDALPDPKVRADAAAIPAKGTDAVKDKLKGKAEASKADPNAPTAEELAAREQEVRKAAEREASGEPDLNLDIPAAPSSVPAAFK